MVLLSRYNTKSYRCPTTILVSIGEAHGLQHGYTGPRGASPKSPVPRVPGYMYPGMHTSGHSFPDRRLVCIPGYPGTRYCDSRLF
eukprot:1594224-Rhodomonas_salina.1